MPPHYSDEKITKELISGLHFIRFNHETFAAQKIERYLNLLGIRLSYSMEFDSPVAIMNMVNSGVGWSIIPSICLLQHNKEAYSFKVRRLPGDNLCRDMVIAFSKDLSGKNRSFISRLIKKEFQRSIYPAMNSCAPWETIRWYD